MDGCRPEAAQRAEIREERKVGGKDLGQKGLRSADEDGHTGAPTGVAVTSYWDQRRSCQVPGQWCPVCLLSAEGSDTTAQPWLLRARGSHHLWGHLSRGTGTGHVRGAVLGMNCY